MTGYVGKTTNRFGHVTGSVAQSEREDQWGPMPGEVLSYDASKGTATIRPLFRKKRWDGSDLPLPDLLDVPIDLPRTGSAGLTMPIPAGTRVQLTPMMRSLDEFDATGDGAQPDPRSYNLSDMRATIAGGDPLSDPLPNVDADNVHLRFDGAGQYGIRGSKEGKLAIEGAEGNVYDLLATALELIASDGLDIKYGSSIGSGHALQNKAALTEIAAKLRAMAL